MNRWGLVRILALFVLPAILFLIPLSSKAQSGDVEVTAVVSTDAPVAAPTIDQPANNFTSSEKDIVISGTCVSGLVVKIFSNSIFIGAGVCQNNGTYSLYVDLLVDLNEIVARQFDVINQPSPDSAIVNVFYIPESSLPDEELPDNPPSEPSVPGEDSEASVGTPSRHTDKVAEFQLAIDYDYTAHGVFVNQPLRLPIHFVGGTGPYTVTVEWGDGSSNNFVRQSNDKFTAEYAYNRTGLFTVAINIVDSTGQKSHLQFVVLIHGDVDSVLAESILGQGFVPKTWTPVLTTTVGITFVLGVVAGAFSPILFRLGRMAATKATVIIIKFIRLK